MLFYRGDLYVSYVYILFVDIVVFGKCMYYVCVDGVVVDNFDFWEFDLFFKVRCCVDIGYYY